MARALLGAEVPGEEELGPRVFLVSRNDFEVDAEQARAEFGATR